MKACGFSERVRQAASSGVWTDELRDHCAACEPCAETTLVTAALCEDAAFINDEAPPLPDPTVLWMRARLERRQRTSRRALQGIVWAHRAALFLAGVIGLLLVPKLWPMIAKSADVVESFATVPSLPLTLIGPALVLMMCFAVLALMAIWNELAEEH